MAKADGKRGGPSRDERISNLRKELGQEGVAAATALAARTQIGILRFALWTHPQRATVVGGLGSRIENMLAAMPKGEADEMRAKFLAAKAKLAKSK